MTDLSGGDSFTLSKRAKHEVLLLPTDRARSVVYSRSGADALAAQHPAKGCPPVLSGLARHAQGALGNNVALNFTAAAINGVSAGEQKQGLQTCQLIRA